MSGRGAFERVDDWTNRNRPLTLLGTVALTIVLVALVNWLTGSDLFRQFFFPKFCDLKSPNNCDPLEWKELFQAAVLVLGLSVAFLLWHWRDRNVRDQIEVQRKDINLKEFQEVQIRAVGAIGSEASDVAKEALQIAALHQLRGFLSGDFGPSFKRPAFETYCSLLACDNQSDWEEGDKEDNLIASSIFMAIRAIVYEDWRQMFWEDFEKRKSWPLHGRSFRKIELPPEADLCFINLGGVDFFGSSLRYVNFSETQLCTARFDHCDLRRADFTGSSCAGSSFDDSNLSESICTRTAFTDCSFKRTKFQMAKMRGALFSKSNGFECLFSDANLEHAHFHESRLHAVDFTDSNLSGSEFNGANISASCIAGTDLTECNFSYAHLDGFFPDLAKSCRGVILNSKTRLPHPKMPNDRPQLTSERNEVLQLWLDHGALMTPTESGEIEFEGKEDDETIIRRRMSQLELLEIERKARETALLESLAKTTD
jgi:uncharacterized protein YjbI with pentapeptide repeats